VTTETERTADPPADTEGVGRLFVVATPIGNLGDITLRAIQTLRSVDVVLAEDTRRTRALLTHLEITGKTLERLDANAPPREVERWIGRLRGGADVALVTDAGTPLVSDPGASIVSKAHEAGIRVVPVPGASAVMAAVSASGLGDGRFRFVGFLPRSGGARAEEIGRLSQAVEATVLFESPRRIAATLGELASRHPNRRAALSRELTKVHEEVSVGTLAELSAASADREWLGEITLVIGPAQADETAPALSDEALDLEIDRQLALGKRPRDVAALLALESGRPKREIYARVLARR
jgi:16S rRNA (cytidine1402-2'-O)-methyltransferase